MSIVLVSYPWCLYCIYLSYITQERYWEVSRGVKHLNVTSVRRCPNVLTAHILVQLCQLSIDIKL